MPENFLNLGQLTIQVNKANRAPHYFNSKQSSPRHIIIQLTKTKDKERLLKAVRNKMNETYKGNTIRLSDFSAETLQARREWNDIFKVQKAKNCQPRIIYLANVPFRNEDLPKQTKAEGVHYKIYFTKIFKLNEKALIVI